MSVRLRDLLMNELDTLRYEPTQKRIRASLGERTVIDSRRAMLVWEPRRVVPQYAVPSDDVAAELVASAAGGPAPAASEGVPLGERRVLDPSIPFTAHTTAGDALDVRAGGQERPAAAFRPADPALEGYVAVDFDAFDDWLEEDERTLAHPRDPFHRVEILHSSRHVRVELDGTVLADTSAPYLLFEPPLPVRYYLAAADVRTDLLERSDTATRCAYKGEASYWSAPGHPDVAWSYPTPLREAAEIAGRIAFFNERVDLVVDGERLERPRTPWSPRQ